MFRNVNRYFRKLFDGFADSWRRQDAKYTQRLYLTIHNNFQCQMLASRPRAGEDAKSLLIQGVPSTHVFLPESPPAPRIEGTEQMQEKERARITCAVSHTCASSPPSIAWNRPDVDATMGHEDLGQGIWRIDSTIQYIPSYEDDKTQLECAITFQNEKISRQSVTLDIKCK